MASGKAQISEAGPEQKSAWEAALAPAREQFADVIGRELIKEAVNAAAPPN